MKIKKNREKAVRLKELFWQDSFFFQADGGCMYGKVYDGAGCWNNQQPLYSFNEKGKKSVWHRKNLPSIFQNQAGWNMMQMKSGQASLELR